MRDTAIIQTFSPEETEKIGFDVGEALKGGEIIELMSDLGGGKTTFTRGLARGAGSIDHVSSPTFTVSKVYKTPKFDIHHFDFYRLPEAGLIQHEIADLLHDPKVVLVIEWGDIIKHILPDNKLSIEIIQTAPDARDIRLSAPSELSYLMQGLPC